MGGSSFMIYTFLLIFSIIGLWLFIKFKPTTYQSMIMDKKQAKELGEEYIEKLVGFSVKGWNSYEMFWHDRDMINRLHHLGLLTKCRNILMDWGLLESWRIRYVSGNKSIIIGLNYKGELTFLDVDLRQSDYENLRKTTLIQNKIPNLLGKKGGLWEGVTQIGEGKLDADDSEVFTNWYLIEEEHIRMKLAVKSRNGNIISVASEQEIESMNTSNVVRQEMIESILNLSGVIGSFVAVICGLVVLIFTKGEVNWPFSLVIGLLLFISGLLTTKEDINLSLVNAFDSRLKKNQVILLGILAAILGSLASASVMFISSLAGYYVATLKNIPIISDWVNQILWGLGTGITCLGIFTLFFFLLERTRLLRISPELSDRTIYLSGFNLKQGLSISIQSSVAEETIYRLLGIAVIWWLTGSAMIGVVITSLLWAFMHQGSGYQPRWIRWFQLVIFGMILGYMFIHIGFISVIIAHFIHNWILTTYPVLSYMFNKKTEQVKVIQKVTQ